MLIIRLVLICEFQASFSFTQGKETMTMKHDPLSFNKQMADAYWMVYLERESVMSAMAYDFATGFCTNCPHRLPDDDIWPNYVPEYCCKDDDDYMQSDHNYVTVLHVALGAIRAVLGEDAEIELSDARERIGKG
jgi:hypothetical protein